MSQDSTAVPPTEAAMRKAWNEVCMVEYRITGDMMKATAFADRIEKTYRDNVRAEVLAETENALLSEAWPHERDENENRLIYELAEKVQKLGAS